MKELEEKAELKGITKLTLMENAGRAVSKALSERFALNGKRVLVVCYHGNNGGDGFAAARYLADIADVEVLFIGDESKLKPEAEINFRKLEEDGRIQFISPEFVDFDDYDITIDAILGTGVVGELKPPIPSIIEGLNASKAIKVSIDIPTGLNPDTGELGENYVNADLIITLHDMKIGLKNFKNKTVVVDIGIPKNLFF